MLSMATIRAEVSHQPTRQRAYHMRGFSSSTRAQRLLTLHGLTQNLFRLGRHPHASGQLWDFAYLVVSGLEGSSMRLRDCGPAQRIRSIVGAAGSGDKTEHG